MLSKQDMISINVQQKEFYNYRKKNYATRIWSHFREGIFNRFRKSVGADEDTYSMHKKWFGDLSTKKVLDLGCASGNTLSLALAKEAKQYVGIDLSDVAIGSLQSYLHGIPSARAIAVDFLSEDFTEKDFDLIYAYSVLHHFPNIKVLIERLNEKLAANGLIISYDPLETSFPVKFMRMLYRPFQKDAAWEWPFTRKTVRAFQSSFEVKEVRGLLGKSKWAFLLGFLPIPKTKKEAIVKKWHAQDWSKSALFDSRLFSCMHLTMVLKKRNEACR